MGIDHTLRPANQRERAPPEFGLPMNAFVKTTKSRLHFKWQGENCCPRMHFCVFKAFFILNGYCYSGEMNRARDSVSKPHAEKSNPTSRKDVSSKTLRDIFFGSPCISCWSSRLKFIQDSNCAHHPFFIFLQTQNGGLGGRRRKSVLQNKADS